jgi:PKD repeat protein
VLTQPNERDGNKGDEVIEFAPGGKGACPQPSGQVEVKVNGVVKASPVSVSQDVPVEFDASSINRAGETPYSFEWSFEGEPYSLVSEMKAPAFLWPNPTAEHTYATFGEYEAKVRVNGDYGTSVFPVKVKVISTSGPVAKITVPSVIRAGQPATFSGAESRPTPESSIVEYHWEFGDGASASSPEPEIKHKYSSAEPETVKLTVTDALGRTAETSEPITISPEETKTVITTPGPAITNPAPPPGPGPGPVVAPPEAAKARIASTVPGSGTVTVTILCPAGNATCAGTVQLQTAASVAGTRGKRARLVLGTASFNVIGGKQQILHLHLSSKGQALLRKAHSLRTIATITTLAGSGRPQITAHGNVTIKATKDTHRH